MHNWQQEWLTEQNLSIDDGNWAVYIKETQQLKIAPFIGPYNEAVYT